MKRRWESSSSAADSQPSIDQPVPWQPDKASALSRHTDQSGASADTSSSAVVLVLETEAVAGLILSYVDEVETLLRLRRCCRSLRHVCTRLAQPWQSRVLVVDSPYRLQRLKLMVPNSMPHLYAVDIDLRSPSKPHDRDMPSPHDPTTRAAALAALVKAAPGVTSLTMERLLAGDVALFHGWELEHFCTFNESEFIRQLLEQHFSTLHSVCVQSFSDRSHAVLAQAPHLTSLRATDSITLGLTTIGKIAALTALRCDDHHIPHYSVSELVLNLPHLTHLDFAWSLPFKDTTLDYSLLQQCSNYQHITHLRGPDGLQNYLEHPPVVALAALRSLRVLKLHALDRLSNLYLAQISQLRQLEHLEAETCSHDLNWAMLDSAVARNIFTLRVPLVLDPPTKGAADQAEPSRFVAHFPNLQRLLTKASSKCDDMHVTSTVRGMGTLLPQLTHLTLEQVDIGLAQQALPLLSGCSQLQYLHFSVVVTTTSIPVEQRQPTMYNTLWLPTTQLASQLRRLRTLHVLAVINQAGYHRETGSDFSEEQWGMLLQAVPHVSELGFYYAGHTLTSLCQALLMVQPPALCTVCALPEFYSPANPFQRYAYGPWDDEPTLLEDEDQDDWDDDTDESESDEAESSESDADTEGADLFQLLDASRRERLLPHIRWTHSLTPSC